MSPASTARIGWLHTLLAALFALLPSAAIAQVKDVTAYHAIVTKDKADLRCGETANYYRIAELPAGTLLSVDGEAADFFRVTYPASGWAYARAESVKYDAATKTATLTEASNLRAASAVGGIKGSWKNLLPQPLPVGTSLKVIDEAKDDEGRIVGYKVATPASARAYVRKADIRQATPAEIETARRTQPATTEATPTPPAPKPAGKPADKPVEPAPAAPPADKTTDGPVEPVTTPPGTDNSLVEPMVKPGDKPADAPVTAPTTTTTDAGANPPATDTPADTNAQPAAPASEPTPRATTIQDLDRSFEAMRRQNTDDAEYQALLAEFQKLKDANPGQPRLQKQLQSRIDWLHMKLEIRERQREIEDMKRKADNQGREVGTKLAELERQRQYAIVGRLLPSSVYDGHSLPLMYRLQSVTGGIVPRTIGYIKPDDKLDLLPKLNQVVGVIGEVKMDPAMSLNLITAQRIDILQSSDGGPARSP